MNLNRDNEWYMQSHHFHENYEILLSLTDAGSCFAESNLYPLKRGTLLVLKDTVLHRTIADNCKSYERYVLHFTRETLYSISTNQTNLLSQFSKSNRCIQLNEDQLSSLISRFEKCRHSKSNAFGDDLKRDMVFVDILLEVWSLLEDNDPIDSSDNSDFKRVSPILKHIENNLVEDLSLDSIAENFYISKYHLCHIFKAATGFSVGQYIISNRILKARSLLRDGCSVQAAGEQAGFHNNAHFIRTFGKLSNISPGRYRKEYQKGIRL
ncbi:AraC family transcriptional regulator [Alkaliphilus metalliredigens]|uniref:AraC family transcriptional regulator n=1 Tax=Alkaliphilus metalliredigens TaxID=208226 RepID=UPI0018DC5872|nr:AraC family transcriptional regulator [Alkaliphilus metalliredigens]